MRHRVFSPLLTTVRPFHFNFAKTSALFSSHVDPRRIVLYIIMRPVSPCTAKKPCHTGVRTRLHYLISLSVCLSVCLSVRLPVCLSVCLSVCLPACLSACLPVCLSVCQSACPSVCQCVCITLVVFTDCESCTKRISTHTRDLWKRASMG